MIANPIKELFSAGKPIINGWISLGCPFVAEMLAELNFDSLTADMQHGLLDYKGAFAALMAMRASGVAPLVRVPWLEPGMIMKSLDAGAMGIICPMINDRKQAESFVSYMKYAPSGVRSYGPIRASVSTGDNYGFEANNNMVSLAMVETKEAYQNVEEIVTTPGLDGIYIGPADLTISLTNGKLAAGFDQREPELLAAIKHILAAANRAGIIAGLHCGSADYAAEAISWGFDLVTLSTDGELLKEIASERVSHVRSLLTYNNK